MIASLSLLTYFVVSLFRSKGRLEAEIVALKHQLNMDAIKTIGHFTHENGGISSSLPEQDRARGLYALTRTERTECQPLAS